VKDAFAANFTDAPDGLNEQAARSQFLRRGRGRRRSLGGSGRSRRRHALHRPTLTPVFSTGKAVMALLMATAVERGRLDYDQTVASLWPDYGQAGKDGITVAQMMSHQDGLPGFDAPEDPAIWFDRQAVLDRLAAQTPMWPPGTASGYHPITIGYLAGEVFRLVRRPLAWARPCVRISRRNSTSTCGSACRRKSTTGSPRSASPPPRPASAASTRSRPPPSSRKGAAPGGRGSTEWRTMEIPSANLHGTARDLARILGIVANGGVLDGRPSCRRMSGSPADPRAHPRPGQGPALCDQLGHGRHAQ
jgi:CubicO group peptidase (beta-lactamase class C family)